MPNELPIIISMCAALISCAFAVYLYFRLRASEKNVAKLRTLLDGADNSLLSAEEENKRVIDTLTVTTKELQECRMSLSIVSKKVIASDAKAEQLKFALEDAEQLIVNACLSLNNFKGHGKAVDDAREMMKKHIQEVNG